MLFWIFLVRCSSRSTVIFLIVSKEIQKYDQRKFYFFFRKETFSNLVFTFIAEKKIPKKIYNFFSVHQNCETKKFAISKIWNKKFRKIHYFANIKYKRNRRKYCGKNLRRNIFGKEKFSPKKIFRKRNSKKILKIILAIFSYLNKIWLIFEKKKSKKILKIIFANFLFLKRKSVNSRLIHQSKDRKLSVNLG